MSNDGIRFVLLLNRRYRLSCDEGDRIFNETNDLPQERELIDQITFLGGDFLFYWKPSNIAYHLWYLNIENKLNRVEKY